MKPAPFAYVRPECLEQALDLLAESGDEAKVLAGGQSLVPLLNLRLSRPSVLVDIGKLEELKFVDLQNERLAVGAGTRHISIEHSPLIAAQCPLLVDAVRWIGHLQIRCRGTIGGSASHADPAAEVPAASVALDARFHVASKRGERVVDAQDFFLGPFTTALEADEVLTALSWPRGKHNAVFLEVVRRPGDFADVGMALWLTFEERSSCVVGDVGIAVCGLSGAPLRILDVEDHLRGHDLTRELARLAGNLTTEYLTEFATAPDREYRSQAAGTLVSRTLTGFIP